MKAKTIFKICYWLVGMGGILILSYLIYCGVIDLKWSSVTLFYVATVICLRALLGKIFPNLK